jgi:phosphoribosylcarboxyaminoimidazole (NCAIR) mutase
MIAALTAIPVVGVPVKSSTLNGQDSLLSIVQMPRGVPVATVAIGNATNAGLLAVRMLGDEYVIQMEKFLEEQRMEVDGKISKINSTGWRKYLEEISKIYHNSLKIRAVINNSLDGQIIDSKINVNEDLVCIYQIVKDFVDSLNPKISQRIAIIDSQNLPKIKCDPLILLDAIRKTMLGFLKTSNQSKINISFIHDHKNQLVIIFYLDNPSLNSELINYANQINSNEIEQIISVMGCRFEIPDNRANTAVIVIPEYRVIDNFDDN